MLLPADGYELQHPVSSQARSTFLYAAHPSRPHRYENSRLSTWGWAVYSGAGAGVGGLAAGQAILNTNGWNEALAKGGKVKTQLLSKKSMRQQFSCHALGAIAAGTWELETFRVNRTSHWSYGSGIHRCNWTTANKT